MSALDLSSGLIYLAGITLGFLLAIGGIVFVAVMLPGDRTGWLRLAFGFIGLSMGIVLAMIAYGRFKRRWE